MIQTTGNIDNSQVIGDGTVFWWKFDDIQVFVPYGYRIIIPAS
jgi:hypothetical protein